MTNDNCSTSNATNERGDVGAGGRARWQSLSPEERKELASKLGKIGGPARAQRLSAKRRSEIARLGGIARTQRRSERNNIQENEKQTTNDVGS